MSEVRVKENESLDSALRRFKRNCAKAGIMGEVRKREHYDKPSVKRKKKSEAARKRKYNKFTQRIVSIMSLKEQLFNDLKTAMKEKDTLKKEVIQIVRAGVLQIEKDNKIDNLDDDSVLSVISKEIKKINDVMPDFEKAGRQDLIDEANKKIELLKAYLPEQLSEAEIEEIVAETIKEVGAQSIRDMGKVMGSVTAKTKGKADNKLVSTIVKKLLNNL